MPQTLTFKGEVITLPEMPEPFYWEVNDNDIDIRKRDVPQNLEGWARHYDYGGNCIFAVVSRSGTILSAMYHMPSWQAALDYLAMRALLGGMDDGEKGDV